MGIAQRHGNQPRLAGALDAEFRQPARHHLAIAALAVIEEDRALLPQDLAGAIGNQRTGRKIAEIGRDHADPMAVMAAEVRLHEMIGHDPGLRRRHVDYVMIWGGYARVFHVNDPDRLAELEACRPGAPVCARVVERNMPWTLWEITRPG